jgi:putative transposase
MPYTDIHLHFVWSTWDRLPMFGELVREETFRIMRAKSEAFGVLLMAADGVADHVHLLARMPASLAPARFIGEIKGASSYWLTHQARFEAFKRQGDYGVFAVCHREVLRIQRYIARQQEHHHVLETCDEWRIVSEQPLRP